MRTHLLHVVPAEDVGGEESPETAANDASGGACGTGPRPNLSLPAHADDGVSAGANDDYWLDGYAGI